MAGKRRKLMKAGQMVGHLRLKRSHIGSRKLSPATRKRWRVTCTAPTGENETPCGKEFVIPEMYLRRPDNPKEHCGCMNATLKSTYNNEYRIFLAMRGRCRDPNSKHYEHYKSRGIDVCEEWYPLDTGFDKFFEHVGKRPSKLYSLDRIDNVRGYEPGNVRWATATQQRANQGNAVAGYSEEEINKAGYTRKEFTLLVSQGKDEHKLISKGKK